MSSAISRPCSPARATRWRKSSAVPSAGRIAVCPPSAAPIAQGLPTSSGPACSALLGPLRCSRPMGWIGGKYSTSKPMAAMAGRRASTSLKVPCTPGAGPVERGKSSYQVLKRARSRSANSGSSTEWRTACWRSGWRRASSAYSSSSASAFSDTTSDPGLAATASSSVAQRCKARRSAPSARDAAAAISSAPTCAAMRTSSGSTRRVISLRHDSKGSTHATTV
ncbi:hypothetical protein FQZ97_957320 [compost metagenome]